MTAEVKDELSRLNVTAVSARKAEVSALLRFAGGLHIVAGRVIVEAEVDLGIIARRLRIPAIVVLLPFMHWRMIFLSFGVIGFLWALDQHQLVAASLGYFLTPLVNVVLGLLVLKLAALASPFSERTGALDTAFVAVAYAGVLLDDDLQAGFPECRSRSGNQSDPALAGSDALFGSNWLTIRIQE